MFKKGQIIRSRRTGNFRVVINWPLLNTISGLPSAAGHDEWLLIGNNYQPFDDPRARSARKAKG